MGSAIRKLRHWKQRFAADAVFVCRRRMEWGGETYEPGDRIPEELAVHKAKLRRFWESGWIELAEFDAPNVATGQVEPAVGDESESSPAAPNDVRVERHGAWYVVTTAEGEHRVRGKADLEALLADLSGIAS